MGQGEPGEPISGCAREKMVPWVLCCALGWRNVLARGLWMKSRGLAGCCGAGGPSLTLSLCLVH